MSEKAGRVIRVNCDTGRFITDIQQLTCLPFVESRDIKRVRDMADSLMLDGLLNPIVVWRSLHDLYLLDGYVRCFAFNYLRGRYGCTIPKIPVIEKWPTSMREAERMVAWLNER